MSRDVSFEISKSCPKSLVKVKVKCIFIAHFMYKTIQAWFYGVMEETGKKWTVRLEKKMKNVEHISNIEEAKILYSLSVVELN